ncbi:MAG: mannose-1-phosphate guanylyltransferase [Anaerovoracaceae bacterium]
MEKSLFAIIMAGGKGTRFWPESRQSKPKQFLALTGDKTLIEQTADRILPVVPPENILTVTDIAYRELVRRLLPWIPVRNVLAEPVGRNTAPCIGLAALHVRKKDPEAVMLVLPADHLIFEEEDFRSTLLYAADLARRTKGLVTIGIRPTAPETGYGYIEKGTPIDGDKAFSVLSFREKPDLETALSFLESNAFFWNSGMFAWKVSAIMEAIERYLPDLHERLLVLEKYLDTPDEERVLREVYEAVTPISIDYGVMEKADNVLMVTGNFRWNDLGSWDALADIYPRDENDIGGRGLVITVDSTNSLVLGKDKLIALVGIKDLVVVESDNAILVMKRGRSQDVRKIVKQLENKSMKEYL